MPRSSNLNKKHIIKPGYLKSMCGRSLHSAVSDPARVNCSKCLKAMEMEKRAHEVNT